MRKIILSVSIIAAVAAIVFGITTAFFSDTEQSTGNTFTAGTLNLKIGSEDPTTWSYSAGDIKPGDEDIEFVSIQNTGSIDGYLQITFANLLDDDVSCNEPEGEAEGGDCGTDGELAENLDILIYIDENSDEDFDLGGDVLVYQGKAKGILQGDLFNYPLPAGTLKQDEFVLERKLDASVGNIVQTDSVQFDIVFELTQNKQEEIVGDWHLDENNGGMAYDNSGYGNNGIITGAGWTDGKYNPGLSFDGVNDYVAIADKEKLRGNNAFTISFWLKQISFVGTWPGVIWKGNAGSPDGYVIFYDSNGELAYKRNSSSFGTFSGAVTSSWRYLTVTYDGFTLKWYVDGLLNRQHTVTFPTNNGIDNLILGRGDQYGNQLLDEVRIYNRALSDAEILAHYQTGL